MKSDITETKSKASADIGCMKTVAKFGEKTEISRAPVKWEEPGCTVVRRADIENTVRD